ncbi:substrate-binding domain-containing protein [Curtobacterium flaccumfaciens pv. oortii]|uniref:substrate-binding domain-containing protein n=1 Tax=Curtobacterium flaccumfaciens TaxID=2035 RepID=UPI001BDEF3D9|nr:substrate-binding domain-containing protein [Curtobacterium flaccumfaciens]MBT1621490.1 substrate-binding domain-containing protein [Curtobacterium flaccumfaciens pv. oortii]
MVRIVAAAVVLTAALALAGCQGTTSAAPTPVQSTDLTSSDGGFDKQAVIGVVLLDDDAALGEDLRTGLADAGFRPDVRVAPASGAAAAQRTAVDQLVRKGAKALLVHAARPSALTGVIQTAHDAGVVVVSLGDPLPASGTGGDGVSADYRVPAGADDADLAATAVEVVQSLQRGEKPETEPSDGDTIDAE